LRMLSNQVMTQLDLRRDNAALTRALNEQSHRLQSTGST
jgi:hypothetical protein